MNLLATQHKSIVILTQIVISIVIIVVGLYQCATTSPVDPLWINLIVFVTSSFLPHPQISKPSNKDDNDSVNVEDTVDRVVSTEGEQTPSNLRRTLFIGHLTFCLIVGTIGVVGLSSDSKDLHNLWASLIAFAVGCLLPTPLTLILSRR